MQSECTIFPFSSCHQNASFFILLFLCKPSSLGTALAYSVTPSASSSLPGEAGKLLLEVLGPAAAPGLEQEGTPGPGIPRFLPSKAVLSREPGGDTAGTRQLPKGTWRRAGFAPRCALHSVQMASCSFNTACVPRALPVSC